ncbi:hypothetical protein E1288_34365 [Saccharopolyspora elongata]|uniref:1-deoxy-D-xylulose 5-phosphate reductoisomerase N-terminal domain-containing protein n=1 Tax=Saccharopolyspora elongata TaxID=2530387 RepID=A0A4R4Y8U8_9PSEU|nr:hypothetical protein E1288_34365 [Saccharopolyspora elongata]
MLGSTGSIGTQALDIIAANPDTFHVAGLAAVAMPNSSARRRSGSAFASTRSRPRQRRNAAPWVTWATSSPDSMRRPNCSTPLPADAMLNAIPGNWL